MRMATTTLSTKQIGVIVSLLFTRWLRLLENQRNLFPPLPLWFCFPCSGRASLKWWQQTKSLAAHVYFFATYFIRKLVPQKRSHINWHVLSYYSPLFKHKHSNLFPQQQTIVRGPIQSGVKRQRSPSPNYAIYSHRLHQPPMKHQPVYSDHSKFQFSFQYCNT